MYVYSFFMGDPVTKDTCPGRIIFSFSGFPLQNINTKRMPVATSSVIKYLMVILCSFSLIIQSEYAVRLYFEASHASIFYIC